MKKINSLLFIVLFLLTTANTKSQVVYSNDFSNWTNGLPDGWYGPGTTISHDSVTLFFDTINNEHAVRLVDRESMLSELIFTSDSIELEKGDYALFFSVKKKWRFI